MRILFVGDTHSHKDLDKLNKERVKELNLSQNDVIVHCGDIGVPWTLENMEVLEYWRSLPCDVVINLGNHENYKWIESQPLITKYGAKGYQMGENMFAPLHGEIATIFNKTFWFFPGGYSIDYRFRILDKSIYRQELPTKEVAQQALTNLKENGPVDAIISHDGPREFIVSHFGYPIGDVSDDYLKKMNEQRGNRVHPAFFLDQIMEQPNLYTDWYFGHHHKDFQARNIRCLMHQIVIWDVLANTKEVV